jgi:hypothetical protein
MGHGMDPSCSKWSGGTPTSDDADAIERWGRCLSGFALALALWPFILERGRTRGRSGFAQTLAVAFSSIAVMTVVYALENVSSTVERNKCVTATSQQLWAKARAC